MLYEVITPIGSGQGLTALKNIQIIVENSKIPVIVDAGIGLPSDAALAMELGVDGILLNSAIAQAKNSIQMAKAMNLSIKAGRLAYIAGSMIKKNYGNASSPLEHFSS